MLHPWREVGGRPDVTITFIELPEGMLGFCEHATRTIFIARGLLQRQRRSVLVHEMTHLDRGPVGRCDRLAAIEERHVERVAAGRLIPLESLIDALMWSLDEHELADELWTDVGTVRDRLRHLTEAERRYVESELDRRSDY